MTDDTVSFNIGKETMMDILRLAASQERTVIEFQTDETPEGRQLARALEITDHVESLEE